MTDINKDRVEISEQIEAKFERLKSIIRELGSVAVAYSGGVDSAFLMRVAFDQLGDNCTAVTADSETIPRSELKRATELAKEVGVKHIVTNTDEMSDPDFVKNPIDRCFHCKKTLFGKLTEMLGELDVAYVIEGSNFSDNDDYRPGAKAVTKFEVRSPLKEAELTKDEIRILSKRLGLPTWDRPAAPCLSSRVPYGSIITTEKLGRIEKSERYLRDLGFDIVRVRDHETVARIEVQADKINALIEADTDSAVSEKLKSFGYQYVTIDLQGFRSGSLNEGLKVTGNGQE